MGDVIVVAAFAMFVLTQHLGLGLAPALLLTAPAMFVLGYTLQFLLLNRVVGKDILPPLLITFGLSIFAQNGLLEIVLRRQPPPPRQRPRKRVASAGPRARHRRCFR